MDPKALTLAHFEKLVLGGFFVWMAMAGVGLLAKGEVGSNTSDMRKAVEDHMAGATVPEPKKPDWTEELRRRLADAPKTEPFPSWVMHRRPGYVYQVEDTTPQYHPVHRPPVNLKADTETRGQIELSWTPSVENDYVLTSYDVMRREGEDGEWTRVAQVGTDDPTRYVDKAINSLSQYYYKVVSNAVIDAEDPVVKNNNLTLDPSQAVKESDVLGPVGTKREVYVFPISVDPITEEEEIKQSQKDATADVKVRKWDSESGKWEEATFWRVKVGDTIGKEKTIRGRGKFDFSTGAVLKEVHIEHRDTGLGYEEEVHVIKIQWPDGTMEEANNKDVPKTD